MKGVTMKTFCLVFAIFVLAITSTVVAFAQPDSLWSHIYGGSGFESCNAVQQTSDGGYILAGQTDSYGAGYDDFWAVKTDANGDTLWTRTYGGSSTDDCRSVKQTSDGGYIFAGVNRSINHVDCAWLVKTDANGDTLWTRIFPEGSSFNVVLQTSDGGYVMGGNKPSPNYNAWLVRTDSSGSQLWSHNYGGTEGESCESLQQTSDGGFIIGGITLSFGAGNQDYWLLKTDANGDSLWSHTYGTSGQEFGHSVVQTSDGGYAMMGTARGFGGLQDFWLVRTDENGDSLWSRVYGGSVDDPGTWIEQTSDNGFILAGYTESYAMQYYNFWLIRTDENGDTLWTAVYGDLDHQYCYDAAITTDGGYIMVGRTNGFGAQNNDFWVLKTERDPLWVPPDVFNLVSPLDEDTVWTLVPTVDWEDATDPNSGDIVSYVIYWSQDSLFTEVDSVTGLTESEYTFSDDDPLLGPSSSQLDDLPDDVVIYWKVRAVDNWGLSRWCNQLDWNFSVFASEPPSVFNLLTPEDGTLLEPGVTSFVWESSMDPDPGDVVAYTLHFDSDEGSVSYLLGSATTVDVNVDTVSVLLPGEDATWYVTAHCVYPDTAVECAQRFSFTTSGTEGNLASIPDKFLLYQNYPNPFNPVTTISFDLPKSSFVNVRVYDLLGRDAVVLANGMRSAGNHVITFDGSRLPSGIYFCRLQGGGFVQTKKMLLLK
jgi:hypothetical protein